MYQYFKYLTLDSEKNMVLLIYLLLFCHVWTDLKTVLQKCFSLCELLKSTNLNKLEPIVKKHLNFDEIR